MRKSFNQKGDKLRATKSLFSLKHIISSNPSPPNFIEIRGMTGLEMYRFFFSFTVSKKYIKTCWAEDERAGSVPASERAPPSRPWHTCALRAGRSPSPCRSTAPAVTAGTPPQCPFGSTPETMSVCLRFLQTTELNGHR